MLETSVMMDRRPCWSTAFELHDGLLLAQGGKTTVKHPALNGARPEAHVWQGIPAI
jgi:hypothetical protein